MLAAESLLIGQSLAMRAVMSVIGVERRTLLLRVVINITLLREWSEGALVINLVRF